MKLIRIYRPQVTIYARGRDGEWDQTGPVSDWRLWPTSDFDGWTEAGFRKVVSGGTEPVRTIEVPDDCELVDHGTTLRLRTPDGKLHVAHWSLVLADRQDYGIRTHRPPRVEPARVRATGPTKQLSMFGD